MSDWRIEVVSSGSDQHIAAVDPLMGAMYAEMREQGPVVPLMDGGARIWLDGIRSGLERFGRLSIAISDGQVVGFAHGALKLLPEHQGGARVGHVTHVHVSPDHRREGIARALITSLDEWFQAKQVTSTEIHILVGNEAARAFWERLGYAPELVQYARRG
ncbi:MAG: GNAT family N-acetyltransferase [Flavobacteriales bacterium]|nr:GNAT family N-acetyltransferase [Flavobacteriales bacterium]